VLLTKPFVACTSIPWCSIFPQWTELVDGLVDVFVRTKDSQWRAQQVRIVEPCSALESSNTQLQTTRWTCLLMFYCDPWAYAASQGFLLGLCTAVKCVQVCTHDAGGPSSPKSSSPDKENQCRTLTLRRATSLPAAHIAGIKFLNPLSVQMSQVISEFQMLWIGVVTSTTA
jgi:hypothetical protein